MLLHCTLAALPGRKIPGAGNTRTCVDIVINVALDATGDTVRRELADRYGPALYTLAGRPLDELTPGEPPFVNGSVIVCGSSALEGRPAVSAAVSGSLLFVVSAGPDAGLVVPLARGTYVIGRSSGDETLNGTGPHLRIADPALSRRHARIEVGTDAVVLEDLQSANGTWLNGKRIQSAVIDTGSALRLGASTCRLTIPVARAAGPSPRLKARDSGAFMEPVNVPLASQNPSIALLLAGALLPLVLGVVLAVVTGMLIFLAFSSLSAVMGLLSLAVANRRRRTQAETVTRAAQTDSVRRHAAAPAPGFIALGQAGAEGRPSLPPPECGWFPVRVGTADQPANVQPVPAQERFSPPVLAAAPVVLMLGQQEEISIAGGESASLARTVLLQAAAAAADGARLVIVCAGSRGDLELNARFLPGAVLLPLPEASPDNPGTSLELARLMSFVPVLRGETPQIVLLCVYGAWAHCGDALAAAVPKVSGRRTTLLRVDVTGTTHVQVAAGRATLHTVNGELPFQPDLVSTGTFEKLARAMGREAWGSREEVPAALPAAVAFGEIHAPDQLSILQGWNEHPNGGPSMVGLSASGPLALDLDSDGPHFLVAGTTGSGKSEFLRAFLTGLALAYPPDALNMLLIDFKGGSGLGPLTRLPHCVGLLTDLSSENVSRALVSLRAEVGRREALFASAGADNLEAYNSARPPDETALPKLVAVVDEFRMLSDAVPTAIPELLRIAAVGRSLGIHLILATQRPQGAITTDIRANITTSVALRVQSATESRDVLGSDCAAGIPPGEPGRGYIRIGSNPPFLFQGLSTTLAASPGTQVVQELDEHLWPNKPAGAASLVNSMTELERICSLIRDAADAGGFPAPFYPVQRPLPHVLDRNAVMLPCVGAEAGWLTLGLLDRPELQRLEPLSWSPATDSHLAVLGSGGSGSAEALDLLAAEHLRSLPGRHLYVLDATGRLAWTAAAPQTGAYVGPNETKRAARVLAYLTEQLATRLTPEPDLPVSGRAAPHEPVTLLVSGWGSWCSGFRQERNPVPEENIAELVRDGEGGGISLVLSGDRELLSSRFFPLVPNRLFFPTDARDETLLMWPRFPPMDPVPGRLLAIGRIGTPAGSCGQFLAGPHQLLPDQTTPLPPGSVKPHRIRPLPALLAPDALAPALEKDFAPVGVKGDELETAYAHLPLGSVFLVLGAQGSGRTGFLHQVARSMEDQLECRWVKDPADLVLHDSDPGQMLLLVDDAEMLSPALQQQLTDLHTRGARIVISAVTGHQLTLRVPLAAVVRGRPLGALLRPASHADADFLGVRLDGSTRWPPGRCRLVDGSAAVEIHVAFQPG